MADVLVLCYHAVSERWPSELAIRPTDLEKQVAELLERGYVATTFSQAVLEPPAERCLAVTFDDGFRSVLEFGAPVLAGLGVPATLFAPTAYMGALQPMAWPGIDQWLGTEWEDELNSLDWAQLRALGEVGWEVGSHSATHPYLTTLPDADLAEELESSHALLSDQLGESPKAIAYPYGDVDRRVCAAAARAGYVAGAALPSRWSRQRDPLDWPRLMIGRDDSPAQVRRRTRPVFRRMQDSRLWRLAPVGVRALRTIRRAEPRGEHPSLARLAPGATLARGRWRSLVVLARHRDTTHSIWPSADSPMVALPAAHARAAAWMRETFEPGARALARRAPLVWHVARSRAALRGTGEQPMLDAAAAALGRPLPGGQVAAYSPSGARTGKLICFVFEAEGVEPALVIRAMADPLLGERLAYEVRILDDVRNRIADPALRATLPPAPLWVGGDPGDTLVAEHVDPLARHAGAAQRDVSLDWLRRFHAATATGPRAWSAQDSGHAQDWLRRAWGFARPRTQEVVRRRVASELAALEGVEVPFAAVHGDFWAGNIAGHGERLRVFDWEWARPVGPPFLDLWTYELAELEASTGGYDFEAQAAWLDGAVARVRASLRERGIDDRFAFATLAASLAELSFRVRLLDGLPGGNEAGARRIMPAVEALLT